MKILFFLACLIPVCAPNIAGGVSTSDEAALTSEMASRMARLTDPDGWREFIKSHSTQFPVPTQAQPTSVVVEKEEWSLNKDRFTLGVGYRQTRVAASLERLEKIVASPSIYKDLFGLDANAEVENSLDPSATFLARIFKKIPILPDQDYLLSYTTKRSGDFVFIRAKLHEDKKRFALRDNLMVLENTKEGVIFREYSLLYILHWYLRALGPQVRTVMNTELTKITNSVKCAAEKSSSNDAETARTCWAAITKSSPQ